MKDLEELSHIGGVKSCRRLVEDIKGPPGGTTGELLCQLDPLCLPPRELGRWLTEFDVGEADIVEGLKSSAHARDVCKEGERFLHRHLKHISDRLSFIADLQGLAVVASAFAHLARDINIGKKVHLDLLFSLSLTGFAAPSFNVETEPTCRVAAQPGVRGAGEQSSDVVEELGVGRRIGAGSAADRGLVDLDHLVDPLDPKDVLVLTGPAGRLVKAVSEPAVEDILDEGALPRSRDPCHADKTGKWDLYVDFFKIMHCGTDHPQGLPVSITPQLWDGNGKGPCEVLAGDRARTGGDLLSSSCHYDLAAVRPGAGTKVDDVV